MDLTSRRYFPQQQAYVPGCARVFLAFEDRHRDLTGLLHFGTVVQIFGSEARWQLQPDTASQFADAVAQFLAAHQYTNDDFVVAIGDPVVIGCLMHGAARQNGGRVTVLKWDRLPCARCGTTKGASCPGPHRVDGRYVPIPVLLP